MNKEVFTLTGLDRIKQEPKLLTETVRGTLTGIFKAYGLTWSFKGTMEVRQATEAFITVLLSSLTEDDVQDLAKLMEKIHSNQT
jgi:hypothetical protein